MITAAMLAMAGCGTTVTGAPVARPSATSAPATSAPATTSVPATGAPRCRYQPAPQDPAARPVSPPPSEPIPDAGTVQLTLRTNHGDIPVTMDRAKAPCTVHSFEHLVKAKFYDDTPCHRLVVADNFEVLQCGDPTGTGIGGPGYTVPDEMPTGLRPAPGGQGVVVYPRGVIALATSGLPNSGGSQFFFVFGDTYLMAEYAIFGTVGEAGLVVLDKIGTEGVDPVTDNGAGDGAPKLATKITQAVLAG